ncbi:ABC transporter ATP-binding protein [Amycolatopsis thermoflava]|uniref:ABC transporter ATP-binding protein n=1 Tax=Amycolatopsis thermoflava TaxID=84480 RepID=UPI0003FEBF9A|nr:ABC transporter ATP-binding protein [Amycolatopsis thermoflava]
MASSDALTATGLGKRYRRGWALRDCDFSVPHGRISALVGPNGAGKTTLMALATGLLEPTEGQVRVMGRVPDRRGIPADLAFLAQDKPLYRGFTVADMLRAGRALNTTWDQAYAERLLSEAGVPRAARIGTLSGGQRTRVALAMALGRRPRVLMLDEPLADLDPIARDEVMRTLMAEAADTGMTVLLSSHVLSDLENVCDHLLLLADGRTRLCGDVADLLAGHRLLVGPADGDLAPDTVVERRKTARQVTALVRGRGPAPAPGWESHEPTLEELVMAHLRAGSAAAPAREVAA